MLKSWLRLFRYSSTHHDDFLDSRLLQKPKPQSGAMLHVCPNRRVILLRNTPHRSFPLDGPDYLLPTTSFTANPIASASSHPRNLSVWKRRSTIQRTFAIQQPRPQHLPRGLIQRVFSQPLRLSAFRLPLPHGSPQRSAKNTLPYVNLAARRRPHRMAPVIAISSRVRRPIARTIASFRMGIDPAGR